MPSLQEAYRLLAGESSAWLMPPAQIEALAVALANGRTIKAARRSAPAPKRNGMTAVIPIMGPLMRRPSLLSRLLGLDSAANTYTGISARVQDAEADASVDRIALVIDSPGGAAIGCEECADVIFKASRTKPVLAIGDGLVASAAYWLGSQSSRFVATPSTELGSIGVFALHLDVSRMIEDAGITPTFIVAKASPRKTEGNELEPLDDDARSYLQRQVDTVGNKFVSAVARGRGVNAAKVKRDFGQGRVMFSPDARTAGMIDAVSTLDRALAGQAGSSESRAAVSSRRRRLELLRHG